LFLSLPPLLASLLAPKGVAGRARVAQAFEKYIAANGHTASSQLIEARQKILESVLSIQDRARSEVTNGLAIIGNTAPVAFWVVWHVFSDQGLLERVREQVESILTVSTSQSGNGEAKDASTTVKTIPTSALKEIPLLFSLIQETIRYRARGTGPRFALDDVILTSDASEFHIEKGATVMLAHQGMNQNPHVWGSDAGQFVPERFLPGGKSKVPANAFRGFGGGANACPGKSFALHEIAAWVAMLVCRFDLVPVGGEGKGKGEGVWREPGQDEGNMAREHPAPKRKVMVRIVPRREAETVVWRFG
jgi:cytochrome P450